MHRPLGKVVVLPFLNLSGWVLVVGSAVRSQLNRILLGKGCFCFVALRTPELARINFDLIRGRHRPHARFLLGCCCNAS